LELSSGPPAIEGDAIHALVFQWYMLLIYFGRSIGACGFVDKSPLSAEKCTFSGRSEKREVRSDV
jgi:hypothetical protein